MDLLLEGAGEFGQLWYGEPGGKVALAESSMVDVVGIVEVKVMIGGIVGNVRISAGMGAKRNCLFWVSNWTVAFEVGGKAGASIMGGSFIGSGGSSSSASVNVVVGVFMSYWCTSGKAGPTADTPFLLTSRPCHLFWYRQISLLPGMLSLSSRQKTWYGFPLLLTVLYASRQITR